MRCIEIVGIPLGPAPLEIRKAWVGLRLPLSQPYAEFDGRSFGSGYIVDVADAVEILGLYNKEAALWWKTNVDWERFNFDEACARVVSGLPSITAPLGHNGETRTVREFLIAFYRQDPDVPRVLEKHVIDRLDYIGASFRLTYEEEEDLEKSAVTRPIVLLLSNMMAGRYVFGVQGASSEEYLEQILAEGHAELQALYRHAVEYGIDVKEEEIDRPLSFCDIGIRSGVIERCEGGIRLTPKGEEIGRRAFEDDQGELPF